LINFVSEIYAYHANDIDLYTHPVLLNWCDNKAATYWVNRHCKLSMISRNLGRIYIGLLMGTKLSIQAECLSACLNIFADDVSCLEDKDGNYDYSQLNLENCRQFQPSPILLGMISDMLLNNTSPDLLMRKDLKPHALGLFIS